MTRFDPSPYIPDGDEARRWAEEELSHARYAEAKPTWFDRLAQSVADFFASLFSSGTGNGFGGVALIVILVVALAALLTVLIVWGRPRAAERRASRARELLGERDDRTAAQLRAEAERAARAGDWDAATILRFRGLARGLWERDLVDPAPGATAQAIAREGARALPAETTALREAAAAFDDVRYLEQHATAEGYRALADTDERLARLAPVTA